MTGSERGHPHRLYDAWRGVGQHSKHAQHTQHSTAFILGSSSVPRLRVGSQGGRSVVTNVWRRDGPSVGRAGREVDEVGALPPWLFSDPLL